MAHKTPEEYRKNRVSYPSDNISPELKKNKEYFLAMAEAMWSQYVSNQCAFPYTWGDDETSFDVLRAYATGRQSMDSVKAQLLRRINPNDPNSRFTTKMRNSWEGYDYLSKMFDIIRSFNSKIDYEVNCTAIDDDSLDIKETDREYIKYYLNKDVRDLMETVGFVPKMKVNPDDVGARTESDVDLLLDSGGFNLQSEIAAQVVCNKTKKESYFAVIQDQNLDDLITLGKAGLKVFVNKAKQTVELMPLDPKFAVVPRSQYPDFRDGTRRGYLRIMTIKQVREESDLSSAQLTQLAKDFSFMNPEYSELVQPYGYLSMQGRQNYYEQYGSDPINDVQVMVLDFEFLSMDIRNFLNTKRESNGVDQYPEVPFDYELKTKDKQKGAKLDTRKNIKKYEAKWIVGSNYFLNYGQSEYVKYKGPLGNRTPTLSHHWAQTKNKSIVERCKPHVDDLNAATFKRRNAINSLPPAPRMIIEQGLLDNVELGGKLQSPEDLIKAFEERGILIVNRIDEFGKAVQVSGKTIEFVPSGILEDITILTNEIISAKEAIKDVTGVNDIVAAQTPQARTGLGVSNLASQASDNALFSTFNTFKYLFEPAFEDVIGTWQVVINEDGLTIPDIPLGTNTVQTFRIGKDFPKAAFNLKMDMVIGENEKQMLLQEITGLKDSRRQNGGSGGITGAQYLKIYDLIMSGNRKLAMFVLAQVEKMQQDRDQSISRSNQQTTLDGQVKTVQDSEAAKQKTYQVEGTVKQMTALIEENAKRKTMLVQALVDGLPGEGNPNMALIQKQIDICDSELQLLLQNSHQDAASPNGPQAPPQPGQPQLQQAS